MPAESPKQTAELYIRSLAPQGLQSTQDAVIRRLDELESGGTLDDYSVVIWGDRLPPESSSGQTTLGQRLHDTVEQFRQWATATGLSLGSFFPTETVRSEITDEEYTCIRFPMLTSPSTRTARSSSSVPVPTRTPATPSRNAWTRSQPTGTYWSPPRPSRTRMPPIPRDGPTSDRV